MPHSPKFPEARRGGGLNRAHQGSTDSAGQHQDSPLRQDTSNPHYCRQHILLQRLGAPVVPVFPLHLGVSVLKLILWKKGKYPYHSGVTGGVGGTVTTSPDLTPNGGSYENCEKYDLISAFQSLWLTGRSLIYGGICILSRAERVNLFGSRKFSHWV